MNTIQKARNGPVELAYTRYGPDDGMPLIMLNGAGGQLVMWPPDLIAELVGRGFQVAVMDTRDTGLSTHLTQYDVPRKQRPPLYTLRDITDDVIAVLDALGWSGVHLFGASMGGMIAQATATYHPTRVRSLTSAMASPTAQFRITRPKIIPNLKVFAAMRKTSKNRNEEGEKWVKVFRAVGSPGYPRDDEHWREYGRLSFDHGLNPRGDMRISATLFAEGDRRDKLRELRCPTLVIHGEDDPMTSVRAGRATAEAIPGAKLVTYAGMGHDFPRELWPTIADEITAMAVAAEREAVS